MYPLKRVKTECLTRNSFKSDKKHITSLSIVRSWQWRS